MKTFLWTTLFWIVAAIAGLLCLWFWNLWTQVLNNEWLASVMPKNLKAESCDEVLEAALQEIDWCAAAEANECTLVAEEMSWDTAQFEDTLKDILENQKEIINSLQEGFDGTNKAISSLSNGSSQESEEQIDEKEQQKLELQAKIEESEAQLKSLKAEMDSL